VPWVPRERIRAHEQVIERLRGTIEGGLARETQLHVENLVGFFSVVPRRAAGRNAPALGIAGHAELREGLFRGEFRFFPRFRGLSRGAHLSRVWDAGSRNGFWV
jgi:hypothetical protein